jgi:hypothetical protein
VDHRKNDKVSEELAQAKKDIGVTSKDDSTLIETTDFKEFNQHEFWKVT